MDGVTEKPNNLSRLSPLGTSVWLDFVSRPLLLEGKLQHMVDTDDVRGVTSNPSIFEKAIDHGDDYDAQVKEELAKGDLPIAALFDKLAIRDVQQAADVLRPVYEKTEFVDGYISLEVSPYLALETEDTITEARRLWKAVGRENLMVKVPGTRQGVPAIRTLIGEGININVTLLFAVASYRAVAEAYMDGLETLANNGGDLHRMASVASFFVSRIDSAVEEKMKSNVDLALHGTVAIANAKVAYQLYKDLVASPRWQALAAKGARPQRLLWASTGTKLKGLPDTVYVDSLVGPDTVNTMPPATMDAVRDHGTARPTIEEGLEAAKATLARLEQAGISLDEITTDLVKDGVKQFADAADKLYAAVANKRALVLDGPETTQTLSLAGTSTDEATEHWRSQGLIRRLWKGDATVWTGGDEAKWVGWLNLVRDGISALPQLQSFQQQVKERAYTHVVLLGMGGSSLGPEVLARTFGSDPGYPKLHIVDSTDPAQLRTVTAAIDLGHTLFIVSSKSGSTLEPNIFKAYFFNLLQKHTGNAAKDFVAVTDPGSALEKEAQADNFWQIFSGLKTVGGRFSVLSMFGLVPAACIGLDLPAFLKTTLQMVHACGPDVPPAANPGVQLGLAMGLLAKSGRDKITLIASPGIADIGAWLEQLFAESTGKQGRGIVPIDNEPLAASPAYGNDRFFLYIALRGAEDASQRDTVEALMQAGHPVARIEVLDTLRIGQEFFRFEIATAVAGAVIGIDPFDQPDVEASKIATRAITDEAGKTGSLPAETPIFTADSIELYADEGNTAEIGTHTTLAGYLGAHLHRLGVGDYAALLAYIERDAATIEALQQARVTIRRATKAATAVGFGPRFLHSTGQAYKGGPNSGVFLQITCADAEDLTIPGYPYGFSLVKAAQALGDLQVLNERKRRALRVHITGSLAQGLATVNQALQDSLR